jgi:hypothetical protein
MTLYEKIIAVYPELTITPENDEFYKGTIVLGDDGDGITYIKEWNYSQPIPEGMKLGK